MNTSSISTKTLSFLLVFFCAALITLLFIFRLSQATTPVVSTDYATHFSTPREIKPFKLIRSDQQTLTPHDFLNHWTILFFGFTHCESICPTTLAMLNKAYLALISKFPNLQVIFVSLDPMRDSPATLAQYIHSFNKNFLAASGKIQDVRKLQAQFGVFSSQNSVEHSKNYQILHSATIFLINPEGKWQSVFKPGLNPKQFASACEQSISSPHIA